MGNIQSLPKRTPSSLVDMHILMRRDTADRVYQAAKKAEQARTAWIRMAIIEKLERDAGS